MEYVKLIGREMLDRAQVAQGHALLFSEDGKSLTAKMPDGTFNPIGGGGGEEELTALADRVTALETAVGASAEALAAIIGEA